MDWAIGKGYNGLYNVGQKRQAAKDELGMLGVMQAELDKDRNEKEQNQIKEQAYQEQISKFSDTLLAPDRDRINARAKELSIGIRENIKSFGGDMGKFFESGGHRIMAQYKGDVINSKESSQYLDNKKNMDRIVELQLKGFGHLINPTDLANMEDYKNGRGSKITYSGQLVEITMPPAENYDYKQEIPAEDILYLNHAKIAANYAITYPNKKNPSEQDYIAYVRANHRGIGNNYQRELALEEAENRKLERLQRMGSAKPEKEDELGPNSPGYKLQESTSLSELISRIPQGQTIDTWNEEIYNSFGNEKGEHFSGKYDAPADDFINDGDGKGWVYDSGYMPRNAMVTKLIPQQATETWGKYLGGEKIEGNLIKGVTLSKTTPLFNASGKKYSNNSDDNTDGEKLDLKCEAVIVMGSGIARNPKTESDEKFLLMDNVEGNWRGSPTKKIHSNRQKEYNSLLKNTTIVPERVMVMRDINTDRVFYHAVGSDNASNAAYSNKDNPDDLTTVSNSTSQRNNESNFVKQTEAEKTKNINEIKNIYNQNKTATKYIADEVNSFYVTSPENANSLARAKLAKAFYIATAQKNSTPNDYEEGSKNQIFTRYLQQAQKEDGNDYSKDLKNSGKNPISDVQIIQKLINSDKKNQGEFLKSWIDIYNTL